MKRSSATFWPPISIWLLLFVVLCFATLPANAKKRRPKVEPQFRLEETAEQHARKFEAGKCAFYCFFVPLQDDQLIELSFYKNMSCSDIVYGFAEVQDEGLKLPTRKDVLPHSYYGNFKLITSMRQLSSSPRVHLGMKMAKDARFLESVDDVELAANVSRRMVIYTRRYGFSGIFLKFDSEVLMRPAFAQFVELLSEQLKAEQKKSQARKLDLILSISSNWVRYVYRRMPRFDAHFDAFYLWADETDSAGQLPIPTKAVPIDPLHHSAQVPRGDALAENAERLAGTGVSRQKIIIGLSAWGRSYLLQNANDPNLPAEVADFGVPGEETNQQDGKLAFQEICPMLGDQSQLLYDNASETISFRQEDFWYSLNEPDNAALVQKLEWIANHEFGGVGLYSIQADDPLDNCSRGVLPLHRSVASRFKCRRGTKRGNSEQLGECRRLCMFEMDDKTTPSNFHFEQLRPGWCSHLVLGKASVNQFLPLQFGPSPGMQKALKMYNDWERERKPFLILSFTGTASQWRLATMPAARHILIEGIRRLLEENNADGVDLNCEQGGPDGSNDNNVFHMNQFLSDLRRTLGRRKQIMVSLNPNSFIDLPYDFTTMDHSVDLFVVIGYRYHRYTNAHTGHHSPLFKNSTLLNEPKRTIQGTLDEILAHHVPKEKLIVALSAEAMVQHFVEDGRNQRSWESRKIGESAARIYSQNRIHGPGVLSQSQVCELKKHEATASHFLNELGVPYLVNDEREFIAYDNRQSIQIKTVWLSLQGLAGIALHGLELDNIAGECPQGEPFPLLRTIVRSQICTKCPAPSEDGAAYGDGTTTPAALTTTEAAADLPNSMERMWMEEDEAAMVSTTPTPSTTDASADNAHQQCRRVPTGQEQQSSTAFSVHCSVPFAALGKNMSLDQLPLAHCDTLLLTGWAKLDAQGTATTTRSSGDGDDESANNNTLTTLASMARENGTALWAELPCAMSQSQWTTLVEEKREEMASSMASLLMANKNLSGLLLDCDAMMEANHRMGFSQLLNEINAELLEKGGGNDNDSDENCAPLMAMKLQLTRTNISQVYVPEQLNKLFDHILLSHGVATSKAKAKALNPLFAVGIANQENTRTQNGTLHAWLAQGLAPGLVVMELPAHGIEQKREDEKAEPRLVGQQKVCQFMRKAGAQQYTRFDALSAYWKTKDEWLSAENQETVKYKVQYAMQHHLGGVLLRSLDSDDPENKCKNDGPFPLLGAIRKASCDRKKANLPKARSERDMLNSVIFSRGRR